MPGHLCFFQLHLNILIAQVKLHYLGQTATIICEQHVYMFVFLREHCLCMVIEKN